MQNGISQPKDVNQTRDIPTSVVKTSRTEFDNLQLKVSKFEVCNSQLKLVKEEPSLPEDLKGYYFVAAALKEEVLKEESEKSKSTPGTFVINGDGMIYRVKFDHGKLTLKTRIAKTPCYYIDQIIQRERISKYPKPYHFRNEGPSRMGQLGNRNQLNTAFLKTPNRLILTFDAGIPWVIDPSSMELIEPLGRMDNWLNLTGPFEDLVPILKKFLGKRILPAHANPAHPVFDYRYNHFLSRAISFSREPKDARVSG